MSKIKQGGHDYYIVRVEKSRLETYQKQTTDSGLIIYKDASFDPFADLEPTAEVLHNEEYSKDRLLILHRNFISPEVKEDASLDYHIENYLDDDKTYAYYFVPKAECYGFIINGEIQLNDNVALVKGSDKERDEATITSGGIYIPSSSKKVFKNLKAIIKHIAPHDFLSVGDEVLLSNSANFEFKINGEMFWLIRDCNRMMLARYEK